MQQSGKTVKVTPQFPENKTTTCFQGSYKNNKFNRPDDTATPIVIIILLGFVQIYSKASPTQVCRYLGSWKYFPFVTCTFFIFTALYKISLCLLKRIFRANNFGSFLLSQTSSEGLLLSASTGRSLVDNTETLWSVKNLNAINIDLSM
ncbi:transmembrane protein, putative [Medicago truncatula]|uniref:Transmembrane protein, putative n=1 Tax=Medicago truncatula TaxID=3880 RepID=A0A072TFV0_MEDTR|nr:transmembrane protein, putative [Medicago truncatula]